MADIARENSTNNTLIITNKHKLLFYLELSHGIGCVLAGLVGVFIATLDDWASLEVGTQTERHSISTPFIISIVFYFIGLLMIHLCLDLKIDKTALTTSIASQYANYNSLGQTNHNVNVSYTAIKTKSTAVKTNKLVKYNIEGGSDLLDEPNARETKGLLTESKNDNRDVNVNTNGNKNKNQSIFEQSYQQEQNEPLLPLTEENLQNSQHSDRAGVPFEPESPIKQRPSASTNHKVDNHPLMTPDS